MIARQDAPGTERRGLRHLVTGLPYLALALILLIAAWLRFYGLAWDSGYLFHPDERQIVLVVSRLHLPSNVAEFFSADSPLNPKFFAYGSLPIYLLKILSGFAPPTTLTTPWRQDLAGIALLGRALSAVFDLGTIALIFLLGRRLYSATIGLLAAAGVAVSVLHIQLAHFYAVDTLLAMLVVATMYFAARLAQMGKRRDVFLVGITFGLALATKITAAPLIVPILVAVVRARNHQAVTPRAKKNWRAVVAEWLKPLWAVRQPLVAILGIALAVFVVAQPYAVLDPIRFASQITTESFVARGWLDYQYTRQYADTTPFIYPIAQSSVWGMSLPLGLLAWGASAWCAWRWLRAHDWRDGFILAWAAVYFLAIGAQYTKYLRYLIPLTPFLFLMLAAQVTRLNAERARVPAYILRFVFSASLALALVYAFAFDSIYSREHPWLTISKWIYANVPANATLAIEHWDDALPVPLRSNSTNHDPSEYRVQTLPMYDADDAAKLQTLSDVLASSDYVVLASQRLSATIERLPQRYPISSRYYRLLFAGQLGFDLATFAVNGIALDGVVISDDRFNGAPPRDLRLSDALDWSWGRADESFVVYDHPLPLVFKKTRALSPTELRALLAP